MDNADVANVFVAAHKRRYSSSATPLLPLEESEKLHAEPKTKQRKKEEKQTESPALSPPPESAFNLLSFCDELLYEIFKYLDTPSILAVMHTSPRLENLLLDHRFWHRIDLSNGPLPLGILEEILGRATEKTHTIKICGPPSSQHVAGEGKQFTCTLTSVFPKVETQLRVLELQGVSLDFNYIHISEFPATLKTLKLNDCSVKVGDLVTSIFHMIERQLVELEDLSIEDSNWFEPYYVMALSKLPALRRLSLKGCQLLCKFVPYASMAARFGFQKLEVLDLRLTPINNSDLQSFSAIENLKELLLESPRNLPAEMCSPEKTSDGNGNDETAAVAASGSSQQRESLKVLNDDEPSTSRAALEHMRACKLAQDKELNDKAPTEAPRPTNDIFSSDNCNERGPPVAHNRSESDDEDTSSTSANSSDNCDLSAVHCPAQNGDSNVRSPLVVIALPGVGAGEQAPPPPAAPNAEAGGEAASPPTPRAFIYVPEANAFGENQRPQPYVAAILEQMALDLRTWRGNHPAHSRFLPRRDQVIYMSPQANREPNFAMHTRRLRSQMRGNFDQVVQHPMFWNMLDPLDRDSARRLRHRPQSQCPVPPQYYVSDRAIYSFGRAARPVQPDVVWIRNINRSPDNRLERISLRNYQHITNNTLEHLVQCSPNLVYIDVSGTSVTLMGLRMFKKGKPGCQVVATHLTETAEDENMETSSSSSPASQESEDP